jgi:hypothetical protein
MREIKFRAWSREVQKMKNWEFIHSVKNFHKLINLDHVELMQFTGLKDDDGIEIYEGDVVSHLDAECLCVIEFCEKSAMFFAKSLCDNIGFDMDRVIKVVGNVYENKTIIKNVKTK